MKLILLAGAASLAMLGACSQSNDPAEDAAATVNAAQDATSGAVGQTSAATLGANTAGGFVTALAVSDMYELQAADIAIAKSATAGVDELAGMIKTDHTASSDKLKTIAPTEASGTVLPTALDERRQGLIDNLNAAAPADFDRVYLTQQVAAHNEALTLLNGFKDHSETPGLAALAMEIIPKVTAHRDHAQRMLDAM
jgi:putative membrane protein